ncbi:TIGR03619 family F420-dependent LLM class oxidoreductase [Streptodolium elevatio]
MPAPAAPRLVLVLSENWTLTDPRDLRGLVDIAREAEDAGFDAVMVSEHIVLGKGADANGLMANPREYALPGNQDPATPWPNSLLLLSAIAAATTRLRLVAAGVIAPLRHPLALAQQLATLDLLSEGRLVAQPIVSWHRPEYEALGVPFARRGKLLDEHLAAWEALWRDTPASFEGEHYRFEDAYLVPKAYRPDGPRLWFGGSSVHGAVLRRLVRYGHGFHPLGRPTADEMAALRAAMTEAGRDADALEMVGGIRPTFPDDNSPAPIALALESIPEQMARGFTTICVKPSQYIDERAEIPSLCREIVRRVSAL